YGYLTIALFLFIESIGIPIPGETALVTAGALAGAGKMSIVGVFVAASLGGILGGMTGYWIGARGGQTIAFRFGRAVGLNDERLERARLFFEQHGASALIIGRFIAVVRSFLGIFAGVAAMPRRRFTIYNAVGGAIWSLTFASIGYAAGRSMPTLMRDLGRVSLVLALTLALVIGLVVGWRWFSANRLRLVTAMEARWRRLDARPWVLGLRERNPRLWSLLVYRFVRGEYLAIHLFIGWLIALSALGVFGSITEDVVEGAPLTRADATVATKLAAMIGPNLSAALRVAGGVGGPQTIALLVAGVAVLFLFRRDWLTAGAWGSAYLGSLGLDFILRRIVRRVELGHLPEFLPNDLAPLPTGHTIEAVAAIGLIAHLLVRRTHSTFLQTLTVIIALSVSSSIVAARLCLSVSYLSIESASVAAGVIWLAACISGLELAKYRRVGALEPVG
ncbi:MAG TPA: DedA family protein, partial [Gemmatimonadaceae bacterium]